MRLDVLSTLLTVCLSALPRFAGGSGVSLPWDTTSSDDDYIQQEGDAFTSDPQTFPSVSSHFLSRGVSRSLETQILGYDSDEDTAEADLSSYDAVQGELTEEVIELVGLCARTHKASNLALEEIRGLMEETREVLSSLGGSRSSYPLMSALNRAAYFVEEVDHVMDKANRNCSLLHDAIYDWPTRVNKAANGATAAIEEALKAIDEVKENCFTLRQALYRNSELSATCFGEVRMQLARLTSHMTLGQYRMFWALTLVALLSAMLKRSL